MPNPKVVFHLGTYKTGTSSIQNVLYRNADILKQNSVLYPNTGLYRSGAVGHRHRGIITEYMDGRRKIYSQPELHAEIRDSGCDMAVMSSEAWSHPNHMALLGGVVAEMQDDGFSDISGVVFLRRLIDYKVSHYREFTFRSGNKVPYEQYNNSHGAGMFDYLYLSRNYRSVFRSGMNFLNFDEDSDSVERFLQCIGMSHLLDENLRRRKKTNTKSVKALGIEVLRLCNQAKIRGESASACLNHIESRNAEMFSEDWTERVPGDMLKFGKTYRQELADLTGWDHARIDALLEDKPITGRHVSEVEPVLTEAISNWQRKYAN